MMQRQWIKDSEERMDEIGFSGFRLIQRPKDFCYGIDAVLLADFAKVTAGGRICDLGTGTGVIPLILKHKTKASEIVGVELQEQAYGLAVRNAKLNGLEDCIHFLHSDILDVGTLLAQGSFDTVVSNPPYAAQGNALKNSSKTKYLARHESSGNLEAFVKTAAMLLKEKGSFFMVHRPSRMVDIMVLCRKYRLEPKQMRLVAPKEAAAANILLLHCVKYGNPELTLLPTLAVHDAKGGYSKEIEEIYERK